MGIKIKMSTEKDIQNIVLDKNLYIAEIK